MIIRWILYEKIIRGKRHGKEENEKESWTKVKNKRVHKSSFMYFRFTNQLNVYLEVPIEQVHWDNCLNVFLHWCIGGDVARLWDNDCANERKVSGVLLRRTSGTDLVLVTISTEFLSENFVISFFFIWIFSTD